MRVLFSHVLVSSDGLVLIEDLRLGGIKAAQPKTNFTTKRSKRHKNRSQRPTKIPAVLMTDDPWSEDIRTVRAMNMEGF